ncbi:MAG: DUF4267 domain-containing protein [Bacteroidales bacterium]|jgi:hypothetical protein|nr:DUF4267 domain-containing protein [Bacteroidales bacterium]
MEKDRNTNIARLLCLLPGLFLIVSGLLLLLFPTVAQTLFDLPDINVLKEPIALAMGIRQLCIGLTITVLAFTKQTKALAYVMLIGTIVPLTDFIVFTPIIGMVSALRHFATVPFIFGIGLYLLTKTNKKQLRN